MKGTAGEIYILEGMEIVQLPPQSADSFILVAINIWILDIFALQRYLSVETVPPIYTY